MVNSGVNPSRGQTLERRIDPASGNGFADLKLPLPQIGPNPEEGKFHTSTVHDFVSRYYGVRCRLVVAIAALDFPI